MSNKVDEPRAGVQEDHESPFLTEFFSRASEEKLERGNPSYADETPFLETAASGIAGLVVPRSFGEADEESPGESSFEEELDVVGEGRVDEVDEEHTSGGGSAPDNTFFRIANDITSVFEGGRPDSLNLYDKGIISYGKHQATLASGSLYFILKRYTELSTSENARNMVSYLARVKNKDKTLKTDKAFIRLLKDSARDPEMSAAQDETFKEKYWKPAKTAAAKAGVRSALSHVLFYCTHVQGALNTVVKRAVKRIGGKVGDYVAGRRISEREFLEAFVEGFVQHRLDNAASNDREAARLTKEAEELDVRAASADAKAARALRRQAAGKRQAAKRSSNNAVALRRSATASRGPAYRALVASGDLALVDGSAGWIRLAGKQRVKIKALRAGSTVDEVLPELGEEWNHESFEVFPGENYPERRDARTFGEEEFQDSEYLEEDDVFAEMEGDEVGEWEEEGVTSPAERAELADEEDLEPDGRASGPRARIHDAFAVSSEDALEQYDEETAAVNESPPLLFDAERPEPEEEVDEEAGLPTDAADAWVLPDDVRRAGESQDVRYDDSPEWDESGRSCSTGGLCEGAKILRSHIMATFPRIREIGGFACRPNTANPKKVSMHGTGRALDIMVPTVDGKASSSIGDPVANWLVQNASSIGVQYLIWNRVRWSGARQGRKFARYTGPNPHRDHIHVELNLDGAQRTTTWFAGRRASSDPSTASAVDHAKAARMNRAYGSRLGWQKRISEVVRVLGLASSAPEEKDFADAVARWQRKQSLAVDGILGPRTWARFQDSLSAVPSPSASRFPAEPTGPIADWAKVPPNQRMRHVMDLLVARYRYPVNGAAGIVGNLWAESGIIPNRIEGSKAETPMRALDLNGRITDFTAEQVMNRSYGRKLGPRLPGVGLAQWTSRFRRDGLFKHVFRERRLGEAILFDMEAQLDYLVTELRTLYRRVDNVLRRGNVSVEEASDEVVYNFEVPGSLLTRPGPDGRRRKLPRTDSAVQAVFARRRRSSQAALRTYGEEQREAIA